MAFAIAGVFSSSLLARFLNRSRNPSAAIATLTNCFFSSSYPIVDSSKENCTINARGVSFSRSEKLAIERGDAEFLAEERVSELFYKWQKKYNRVYKDLQEAEKGFQNFRRKLRYIIEFNSKRRRTDCRVGLNQFFDMMSHEEFRPTHFGFSRDPKDIIAIENGDIVNGVKDQGQQCGAMEGTINSHRSLACPHLIHYHSQMGRTGHEQESLKSS